VRVTRKRPSRPRASAPRTTRHARSQWYDVSLSAGEIVALCIALSKVPRGTLALLAGIDRKNLASAERKIANARGRKGIR
jgi:hypothetical protein